MLSPLVNKEPFLFLFYLKFELSLLIFYKSSLKATQQKPYSNIFLAKSNANPCAWA